MAFLAQAYDFIAPHLAKIPIYYTAEGSIAAMLGVVYLSKVGHSLSSFALTKGYDNVQASFRYGGGKPVTWQQKTVQRAYNAHQNQWEAFTGFAAAMLLAKLKHSGVNPELALLGNAFLACRVVYNVTYIVAFNDLLAAIRSSTWLIGIIIVSRIFMIALN